ncbi:hypothetical protein M404DRAFT_1006748 [Pisolithus tinctorius Marx 270]|uniref:Uncharacterized protein n=1 Tax=Pisolithus tinctorius Marx 270 TaxID=870435 RepID=A0A0C3JFS2_PISTI|nr:hypothetical protein M404DRAFT_1006748 [Pisolithus tinctorius Marx 270]
MVIQRLPWKTLETYVSPSGFLHHVDPQQLTQQLNYTYSQTMVLLEGDRKGSRTR